MQLRNKFNSVATICSLRKHTDFMLVKQQGYTVSNCNLVVARMPDPYLTDGTMQNISQQSTHSTANIHSIYKTKRVELKNNNVYKSNEQAQQYKSITRFGLVVSKQIGNAVIRNRVKRKLRAMFSNCCYSRTKLISAEERGFMYVLIARQASKYASLKALTLSFLWCIYALDLKTLSNRLDSVTTNQSTTTTNVRNKQQLQLEN